MSKSLKKKIANKGSATRDSIYSIRVVDPNLIDNERGSDEIASSESEKDEVGNPVGLPSRPFQPTTPSGEYKALTEVGLVSWLFMV
ncbi:hypothetical protein TorRG33x02_345410 [Trema orientale]|uniref:Uncharacterized protein n=1 Tax=Trema orientale TaxID=63057 RepID=A0A2P5AP27_TREOI|nr:hypothetical protein TorRG33x02_345410 [Trema orientale]